VIGCNGCDGVTIDGGIVFALDRRLPPTRMFSMLHSLHTQTAPFAYANGHFSLGISILYLVG
jgi:hypothetical protein